MLLSDHFSRQSFTPSVLSFKACHMCPMPVTDTIMGQEYSQPLVSHAPTISPASARTKLLHQPFPIQIETNNIKSTTMEDHDPIVEVSNLERDYLDERVDSTPNNDDCPGDTGDIDMSDETQQLSDTFEQHPQQPSNKYDLRPGRQPKRTLLSTWVDGDLTGDFDPREESRRTIAWRKRARYSHRKKTNWNLGQHANGPSINTSLLEKPMPCLRLTFSTSLGKARFSELDSKLEQQVKPARDNFTAGYQLRRRDGVGGGSSLKATGSDSTGLRVISSEPLCDYSNHPVARGCITCLAMGRECSLLKNEHSWPCDDCEEEENDCELVEVSVSSFSEQESESDNVHRNPSLNRHAHIVNSGVRKRNGLCVRSNTVRILLTTAVVARDASAIATTLVSQALDRDRLVRGPALLQTERP
jgi:hypothetical protein